MKAIFYAFLAAVFYAINIPASKVLLRDVGPTTMAALLYLGGGIGIASLSLPNAQDRPRPRHPLVRGDGMGRDAHLIAKSKGKGAQPWRCPRRFQSFF